MQKPIILRKETWEFLQEQFKLISPSALYPLLSQLGYRLSPSIDTKKILEMIAENPGRFLVHISILKRADLLEKTVIADETGLEFIITKQAAEQLQMNHKSISLIRILDRKTQSFTFSQVLHLLTQSDTFDQLD